MNEGTIFSTSIRNLGLSGAAENAAFNNFIENLVIDNSTITNDVLNEFQNLFKANDPSNGAPFATGDSLFDRGEAWYTDNMFLGPRRNFVSQAADTQPIFVYYFQELIPGNDPTLGGVFSFKFHCSQRSNKTAIQCPMSLSWNCSLGLCLQSHLSSSDFLLK